jgi:hypothetical protein
MAQTFVEAANPIWYIPDLTGLPAGGGTLFSFNSLDPTVPYPIFQDNAGLEPFPNPILLGMNGTIAQPMYFLVDTSTNIAYDLFVYDSSGNLIWNVNNFLPPGGGGGTVNTSNLNDNLVVNNVMYRGQNITGPLPLVSIVAPGTHSGLAQTVSNFGPDIQFIKNNTNANDSITLAPFTSNANPLTNEVTPYQFFNYTCTNMPSGETVKYLQFPITSKVQSLSNLASTQGIFAMTSAGSPSIQLQWVQFFGDGTNNPTATQVTTIGSPTLTTSWAFIETAVPIPALPDGVVLGNCGNDGLFLQILFPINAACNISICKPSAFLGSISPNFDYTSYDQIESVDNTNRTGDIRVSLNAFQPYGWVAMNDGLIGTANPNSVANVTRANLDTFPLFNLIWNSFFTNSTTQLQAPMFTTTGTPIAYGASSIADFAAGNFISLTKQMGRALAAVGTPAGGAAHTVGSIAGIESFLFNVNQLPTNFDLTMTLLSLFNVGTEGTTLFGIGNPSGTSTFAEPFGNVGGGQPVSVIQPTSYLNVFMKL